MCEFCPCHVSCVNEGFYFCSSVFCEGFYFLSLSCVNVCSSVSVRVSTFCSCHV